MPSHIVPDGAAKRDGSPSFRAQMFVPKFLLPIILAASSKALGELSEKRLSQRHSRICQRDQSDFDVGGDG